MFIAQENGICGACQAPATECVHDVAISDIMAGLSPAYCATWAQARVSLLSTAADAAVISDLVAVLARGEKFREPITLTYYPEDEEDEAYWSFSNGMHRMTASMIAGVETIPTRLRIYEPIDWEADDDDDDDTIAEGIVCVQYTILDEAMVSEDEEWLNIFPKSFPVTDELWAETDFIHSVGAANYADYYWSGDPQALLKAFVARAKMLGLNLDAKIITKSPW